MGTSISSIITVTTPPLGVAPGLATGLTVSNLSATSLTLSWTAPTTGSLPFSYQVQSTTPIGGSSWTNQGGALSVATLAISGLTAATGYSFRIITTNSTGSSTSASVSATTLSIAPGAPTGLSIVGTPTSSTVSLQWNAPAVGTPPLTYQVLSRTPSGSGSFVVAAGTTTATTQTISGLNAGTSYDFEVYAANAAGAGQTSAILSDVLTAGGAGTGPGPATGLAATSISTTSLTLSWVAPTTGTLPFTYQPQQAPPGSSPTWTNIGSSISATTVAVTGLTANTAYQFQVVTTNSTSSSISASIGATTASILPSAPTALAVSGSPTTTTISLQWSPPATGSTPFTFQVLSRTPSGSGTFAAAAATTTASSQTITGLSPATGYDFEVEAENLAGTGPASSILLDVVTASGTVSVGPATGLTISSLAATSLTLSWTAPSTGTPPITYQPQVALAGGSPSWSNIGSSISATTVAVTGLTANTAYQFQVISTNAGGNSTSASVAATTLSVLPTAPTALAVSGTPTQTTVGLTWSAPGTGTSPFTYQVLLRTPSGSGSFTSAGATTTSTAQTISGLSAGTTYDFEVSASNGAGTGPESSILADVSTSAASAILPSAPQNLTVGTITSTSIAVSWSTPATGTPPFNFVVQYEV